MILKNTYKQILSKGEVIRLEGKLKEIITIKDEAGNTIHKILKPLMVEFYLRDAIQVIVGSIIIAIPISFTQEVWDLGTTLPLKNILYIMAISLILITLFIYTNYYKGKLKNHKFNFFKRVILTYIISFITVGFLLTLINQAPWSIDWVLAFKRTALIVLPASMGATIADVLK